MEERRRAANLKRLYEESLLPAELQGATLTGMDISHRDTACMVEEAGAYIGGQTKTPFLILLGGNGNGKTRVAASIARSFLEAERPVLFAYLPHFLERLQRGQFTGDYPGKDHFDLLDRTYGAAVLVLDDLGLYKATEWADVQVDKIIGYRFMHNLPTVVTSNLKLGQLTVRMRSRFTDGEKCRIVVTNAPDYRAKKRG